MFVKNSENDFDKDNNGDFPINTLSLINEDMNNGTEIIYRIGLPEL